MLTFAQPRRRYLSVNYFLPDGRAVDTRARTFMGLRRRQLQDHRQSGACPWCQRFDGCEHTYVPADQITTAEWAGWRSVLLIVGSGLAFWSLVAGAVVGRPHATAFAIGAVVGTALALFAVMGP